jgi:ATP-dependent RNA helicase RhlE
LLPGLIPQESVITQSYKNEGAPLASAAVSPIAVPQGEAQIADSNQFAVLGLAEPILRAVTDQGYTIPTPIQAQAIPIVMSGRDLLGAAQTGTGKTAGFTLPLLHRLAATGASQDRYRKVRALILVPTRELCAQVQDSVKAYGKHVRITSTCIYGGVGFMPQVQALRRGADIVVATPGRLLDHVQQRTIDLRSVEILVMDEADRMLDMGFIPDMRRIVSLLPKDRQTLLFSATFSEEIRKLAADFQRDPVTVEVARRNAPIELVTQVMHPVDKDRKRELLAHLVKTNSWQQVLVFTKTKHGANRLAEQLSKEGIESDAIHGNKSQPQRMRALKRFKDCEVQVLVATDIAARGIDIDALPHVVNYDLPNVAEDYVHRIGRTGRAGMNGDAVSLVCSEDRPLLAAIERLISKRIEQELIPGFEPAKAWSEQRQAAPKGGRSGDSRRKPAPSRRHGGRPEQNTTHARSGGKPQEAGRKEGYAGAGSRNGNGPSRNGSKSSNASNGGGWKNSPPARRAPKTSWEAEREAQRKHFSARGEDKSAGPAKGEGEQRGKGMFNAMANLLRKVA